MSLIASFVKNSLKRMDSLPKELTVLVHSFCTPITKLVLAQVSSYYLSLVDKKELLTDIGQEYGRIIRRRDLPFTPSLVAIVSVIYGSLELVQHFIRSGWKHNRYTLSHIAIQWDHPQVLDYLYRRLMRTEPIVTTMWIKSPDVMTMAYDKYKCLRYLIEERGLEVDEDMKHDTIHDNCIDSLKYLLENSHITIDSDDVDNAAMCGSLDVLKYLIGQGYEFNNREDVLKRAMKDDDFILEYLVKECGFSVSDEVRKQIDEMYNPPNEVW